MADSFVEQLVHLRHAKKLTQRELGELSGVPYVTIARIESGRILPNLATVDKLLDVLQGEARIIEKEPGFRCKLKVSQDRIKLPLAVLKRLGLPKGTAGSLHYKDYKLQVSAKGELQLPEEVLRAFGNPQELELSTNGSKFLLLPIQEEKRQIKETVNYCTAR